MDGKESQKSPKVCSNSLVVVVGNSEKTEKPKPPIQKAISHMKKPFKQRKGKARSNG